MQLQTELLQVDWLAEAVKSWVKFDLKSSLLFVETTGYALVNENCRLIPESFRLEKVSDIFESNL